MEMTAMNIRVDERNFALSGIVNMREEHINVMRLRDRKRDRKRERERKERERVSGADILSLRAQYFLGDS